MSCWLPHIAYDCIGAATDARNQSPMQEYIGACSYCGAIHPLSALFHAKIPPRTWAVGSVCTGCAWITTGSTATATTGSWPSSSFAYGDLISSISTPFRNTIPVAIAERKKSGSSDVERCFKVYRWLNSLKKSEIRRRKSNSQEWMREDDKTVLESSGA